MHTFYLNDNESLPRHTVATIGFFDGVHLGHQHLIKMVMDAALPLYRNLYTMHKYNGESLTTYEPRGPWAKIHTDLASLGSTHIENVHVLANLEPFRWSSPDFVQKATQAMHNVHHANALHIYPQASYWDWPAIRWTKCEQFCHQADDCRGKY